MNRAEIREAADRLYAFLCRRHVDENGALVGPDPGVGLNLRVLRFIKSYSRALSWPERIYYLQGQAYWIFDNLEMYQLTGSRSCLDSAIRCADCAASRQRPEGHWEYPMRDWRGRIVTVEGCFGALGMLAAYGATGDNRYLDGARRWYDFMVGRIGFQRLGEDSLAVNYFADQPCGMVPNNSTLALWFAAALAKATGEDRYREYCPGLLRFLAGCRMPTGELPYVVEGPGGPGREHYLCFQYNAFEFLDLAEYQRITGDDRALSVMKRLAEFLSEGLTPAGDARHDCATDSPVMHYFTAAVSAALLTAAEMGLGDYCRAAARGYQRLISLQRRDGGFDYSLGDYGFLSDRRSYPRNQAMILRHLLAGARSGVLT